MSGHWPLFLMISGHSSYAGRYGDSWQSVASGVCTYWHNLAAGNQNVFWCLYFWQNGNFGINCSATKLDLISMVMCQMTNAWSGSISVATFSRYNFSWEIFTMPFTHVFHWPSGFGVKLSDLCYILFLFISYRDFISFLLDTTLASVVFQGPGTHFVYSLSLLSIWDSLWHH